MNAKKSGHTGMQLLKEREFALLAHSNRVQDNVRNAEVKEWRGIIARIAKIRDSYMKARMEA